MLVARACVYVNCGIEERVRGVGAVRGGPQNVDFGRGSGVRSTFSSIAE
jgi:hypothetical protein